MKQIKTLTVNGESYRITDPEAARLGEVVERLCPPLEESGAAVRCTPVKDYPLQVVSHLSGAAQTLTLHHCGKNIFDIATAGVYHNNASDPTTDMTVTEEGIYLTPVREVTNNWSQWGFYLGTAKELAGKTITLSAKVETSSTVTTLPFASICCTSISPTQVREKPRYQDGGYFGSSDSRKVLVESGFHDGHAKVTYTVTGNEIYPYICLSFAASYGGTFVPGQWTKWSDIQVEVGNAATAYEPYNGQSYTAQPGSANRYDWADIRGLPGVNTLWCDDGTLTVTGRADPVAEMETLKNAIIALGGNL